MSRSYPNKCKQKHDLRAKKQELFGKRYFSLAPDEQGLLIEWNNFFKASLRHGNKRKFEAYMKRSRAKAAYRKQEVADLREGFQDAGT